MQKTKIIVRPTSCNLWWGVYGLSDKTGYEDLYLYYENEEKIGGVCLNARGFLKDGLDDLKKDPDEKEFVDAVEKYLVDSKCHYWYFYDQKDSDDIFEVPYDAPKNSDGIKPNFTDIWHPDESIGLSTIKDAVKEFAKKHLGLEDCEIEIQNGETLEESIESFEEHQKSFGLNSEIEIRFSDELIEELCQYWKKSPGEVSQILEKSIK